MGYGIAVHISNIFIHNQKSHKINVRSYKNLEEHYMQILLDIENKESIAYLILLLAIEKFNNGEHIYIT